jgi:hypothetical protein
MYLKQRRGPPHVRALSDPDSALAKMKVRWKQELFSRHFGLNAN